MIAQGPGFDDLLLVFGSTGPYPEHGNRKGDRLKMIRNLQPDSMATRVSKDHVLFMCHSFFCFLIQHPMVGKEMIDIYFHCVKMFFTVGFKGKPSLELCLFLFRGLKQMEV